MEGKQKSITDTRDRNKLNLDDPESFFDINPFKNENSDPGNSNTDAITLTSQAFAWNIWRFKMYQYKNPVLEGIYREGVYTLLTEMGYYKRYNRDNTYIFIHDENNIISSVEISQMRDRVTKYIERFSGIVSFFYCGMEMKFTAEKLRETLYQNSHLLFNPGALGHLKNHERPILRDTKTEMFFPFSNCVVSITSNGVRIIQYKELKEECVWMDHIIKRKFIKAKNDRFLESNFARFINNVSNNEPDRKAAFISAIGYLLHNYGHQSKGRAVIGYDEEITELDKPGGGTGKGVFAQALKQLRQVVTIDGKRFDPAAQFVFQDVNERTQITYFDDVKRDFDFLRFNSILTEGWHIEQKNKSSFRIEPENSPKVYITSNSIIKGEGTTIERRQFILEFSPFYSRIAKNQINEVMLCEPIKSVHGCLFFDNEEWSPPDWDDFYNFMIYCAFEYMKKGLQFYKSKSVSENKVLQNTSSDFLEFIGNKEIRVNVEFSVTDYFIEFKTIFWGAESNFAQRTFTNWLKIYSSAKNLELKFRTSNGKRIGVMILKQ